jgi:CRP/FNR family transcriptional regulator
MDVVAFVKKYPVRSFVKGEVILSEGEISTMLLALRGGYVKVTAIDDDGNEKMLWIAGRYDIVPTEQLFSTHAPLRYFYTALTDGEVFQIPKTDFLMSAKTDVGLMTEIATSMSIHYDDLMSRVSSIGEISVHNKLIATLRYIAERFSADQSVDLYSLGLHLTHRDLADLIGSTRETTSLELQKLRAAGIIEYDRTRFIVHTDKCAL